MTRPRSDSRNEHMAFIFTFVIGDKYHHTAPCALYSWVLSLEEMHIFVSLHACVVSIRSHIFKQCYIRWWWKSSLLSTLAIKVFFVSNFVYQIIVVLGATHHYHCILVALLSLPDVTCSSLHPFVICHLIVRTCCVVRRFESALDTTVLSFTVGFGKMMKA